MIIGINAKILGIFYGEMFGEQEVSEEAWGPKDIFDLVLLEKLRDNDT